MTMANLTLDDTCIMTAADVQRVLGLSKFTLLRMRQCDGAGGLPFVQLSEGRVGYLRNDVLAYIAARRVGSLPTPAAA